ncbi:PREDICTED: E3 ubiquitin-protein ligase TRIM39-like [Nanorana parkeri]|uniref:E3 ubiquitin-protein ligase TRIM39-like n=1 Tax=Nanorana parkeri TaxID=125878 RepID=UPI000854CC4F|nr:PREDICTED: E3 ubiquitin-protein ligase TRIM39-like [Nanorana parkeri]
MALAISDPVRELQDEVTCAICLDHFKDPVSIECGHCFCRACIIQTWRGIRSNFPCPHCRKTSKWKFLRPNRPLENVLEISNRMLFTEANEKRKKQCRKHQEPLKFYCQVDGEEICVICRESVDHRSHVVMPVEETTREFQVDIQERLIALRNKVADIKKIKGEEEETALKLQDEVVQKRKMVAAEFESLRQLLADQEKHINNRLENMQKTILQKHKDSISRLNTQLSSTQKTIADLEENARPLLSQSYQSVSLWGYFDFTSIYSLSLRHNVVSEIPNFEFVHPLFGDPRTCNQQRSNSPKNFFKAITVALSFDLKTVNQNLLVICNRKCVKYVEDPIKRVPCPERFDSKPCVLATAGFELGRHYWEVEVGGGIYWSIGVAKWSVRRKGGFRIEPNGGIWAIGLLGMYMDRYYAFTNPDSLLNPRERPERIGVFLNSDEGCVSFYNAVSFEHLFTFNTLQAHDKMFPFFCVGAVGTELRLDDDYNF